MYRVAIITLSDKGARGEREDVSGQVIEDMVKEAVVRKACQFSPSAEISRMVCRASST